MRHALLLLLVSCTDPNVAEPPALVISFPEVKATGATIPFRAGGPFAVTVTAASGDLGQVSHATVEIATAQFPMDATPTATITLLEQQGDTLAGTAVLKWPPGGPAADESPLHIRAIAGNAVKEADVPLEAASLTVTPGALSNTGAQLVQSLCFDSTSSDGTLALHLTGAKLDSGQADGTAPLLPGKCMGALDPKDPSSYARLKVSVTDQNAQVMATLPPTQAIVSQTITPPITGTLTLSLATSKPNPAPQSIVDVTVTAEVNGVATKDIVVAFQSIPAITLVPSSVKTNTSGQATMTFQMPKDGGLRIIASSGDVTSNALTF